MIETENEMENWGEETIGNTYFVSMIEMLRLYPRRTVIFNTEDGLGEITLDVP